MGESQVQRQTVLVYARQMPDFACLDQCLSRLSHPAVRDLAWTLLAPPLLRQTPFEQRHPLSGCDWSHAPALLEDWLLQQDLQPAALLNWLSTARSQRLGMYYERLWQFALQQAPGIELLGANLAIRQDGRTLGELDVVLRDAQGVHHLELAIKLYLGPGAADGRAHAHWQGAGHADNLARKLQHLGQQQLPLSSTPQALQVLAGFTAQAVQASVWMSGYLFYPWPSGCHAPSGMHPQAAHGQWLELQDWPAFRAANKQFVWQPVPTDCRLAPVSDSVPQPSTDDWLQHLPASPKPVLLAGLEQSSEGRWLERQRVMLLRRDWSAGN